MLRRLAELRLKAEDPALWQDTAASALVQRERTRIEREVEAFVRMEGMLDDAADVLTLAEEDPGIASEIDGLVRSAGAIVERLELQRMLGGEYDRQGAVVSVNAGAGGLLSPSSSLHPVKPTIPSNAMIASRGRILFMKEPPLPPPA